MTGKPSSFMEYASELYEKFVEQGLMKRVENDDKVPLYSIILHATQEQRDKLGELLTAAAIEQGEDGKAVRDEWDSLVQYATRHEVNSQVQIPTWDNMPLAFSRNPYRDTVYHPTHKAKHQCNRKPKPKPRGVKHGNRKKKR